MADMPPIARQRRFFLILAIIMAVVIVAGFSTNLIMGRSSFGVPVLYHVHAFVFFGWLGLYVLQNLLVDRGSIRLHRTLGLISLAYVPLLLVLAVAIVIVTVRRGVQFFFDIAQFYISNILLMLCFVGLTVAALMLRGSRDWHPRLMIVATCLLTEPGFGRLLPMPLLVPYSWYASLAPTLLFPIAGAIFDKRHSGRVHPAWIIGIAAIAATQLVSDLVAYSDLGTAIVRMTVEGTPGGARPLLHYTPQQ